MVRSHIIVVLFRQMKLRYKRPFNSTWNTSACNTIFSLHYAPFLMSICIHICLTVHAYILHSFHILKLKLSTVTATATFSMFKMTGPRPPLFWFNTTSFSRKVSNIEGITGYTLRSKLVEMAEMVRKLQYFCDIKKAIVANLAFIRTLSSFFDSFYIFDIHALYKLVEIARTVQKLKHFSPPSYSFCEKVKCV